MADIDNLSKSNIFWKYNQNDATVALYFMVGVEYNF